MRQAQVVDRSELQLSDGLVLQRNFLKRRQLLFAGDHVIRIGQRIREADELSQRSVSGRCRLTRREQGVEVRRCGGSGLGEEDGVMRATSVI